MISIRFSCDVPADAGQTDRIVRLFARLSKPGATIEIGSGDVEQFLTAFETIANIVDPDGRPSTAKAKPKGTNSLGPGGAPAAERRKAPACARPLFPNSGETK